MGIGAYTVAVLMTMFHFNFFLAVLVGMILSMALGYFLGFVFSKLSGDYFVLATLSFTMIVYSLAQNLEMLTRGPLGIPGIGPPILFGFAFNTHSLFLILAILFFGFSYLLLHFVAKSSFGRVLQAIREDDKTIQIFGYNTRYYKLIVFVITSAFCALAGGLFASYLTFIDPPSFNLTLSIFVLATIIVGGLSSLEGTILGVFLLVLIPEVLRFIGFSADIAGQSREFVYGLILVLFMLYRPKGILGKYRL
ncbi:MAG: branched-chain amino acid transport system permease protein [Parcubacteria group bacterium Gr01-1014_24]|nr:MAG: branched-chain amino acid transport system permease protein [Parcubacteria group bacterium Gr01-1014_24]